MRPYCKIVGLLLFLTVFLESQAKDFAVKAAYLDFRTQVMTLHAMKGFADDVATRGLNAIVLEYEATFPFQENLTLRNRYAFSEAEIREFIDYCSGIGVEVIPLQNCFGHAEYILRHERYASLKENRKDCSQVCPMKIEEATKVFRSIFGEVAAMHPSMYIHIGCDETRLLGHCAKCREVVRTSGISKLYVDYVTSMCNIVTELGKTPMIWADIILKHPEALSSLPDNVVIVDWNYGWKPDHFGKMENIEKSGHPVWGASSLRSHPDNIYLIQWRKHLDNIFDYSDYAASHGFQGFINTSWSTSGTYGYIYDDRDEVVDMQPVREVYPQNGFDMLDEAYASAISGKHKDPEMFLDDYCRIRLGLTRAEDIASVKAYFNMKQAPVYALGGRPDSIRGELDKCLEVRRCFVEVVFPPQAKAIAEHLELMQDIRINYLKFKLVEANVESDLFTMDTLGPLLDELRLTVSECEKLRKRFFVLHNGYLKDPRKAFDEWTYYGKMKNLISTLGNM